MSVIEHWPERIVAVTDGEDEPGALIEYRRLEPDETTEACDVEYMRADLHRGAVVARAMIERINAGEHDAEIAEIAAAAKRRQMMLPHLRGQ